MHTHTREYLLMFFSCVRKCWGITFFFSFPPLHTRTVSFYFKKKKKSCPGVPLLGREARQYVAQFFFSSMSSRLSIR